MKDESGVYTTEQAIKDVMSYNRGLYDSLGMTAEYLAKKHKEELNATKPTRLKVKGAVTQEKTPSGKVSKKKGLPKIVAVTGLIETIKGDNGLETNYTEGETVLEFHDADMSLRQKARMDATKMRAEYPNEKIDVGVSGISDIMKDVMAGIDGANRGKVPSEDEH